MSNFSKIEEHLLSMHAGMLKLCSQISEKSEDYRAYGSPSEQGRAAGMASILKTRMTLVGEKLEEMALQAASLNRLHKIAKRQPETTG